MDDLSAAFDARLKARLQSLGGPVEPYTFDDLIIHLRDYKRRRASTIQSRLVQLAFMERHPEMPVELHGDRATLVVSFYRYVRHRELVEGAPATTLVNDHKAIRALGDFLGIPKEVWPTAPTVPITDERWVPTPEQVYDLLHAEYTPNAWSSYSNALVKALLLLDFGIGVRFPSEAHALQLDDFDRARHLLVVTEPKKSMRRRTLLLEPEWMCCSQESRQFG